MYEHKAFSTLCLNNSYLHLGEEKGLAWKAPLLAHTNVKSTVATN